MFFNVYINKHAKNVFVYVYKSIKLHLYISVLIM